MVEWYKPYVRPTWITAEEYASRPKLLPVRECRYAVDRPGFRVRTVTLVTTLLDAEAYPLDALADLYRRRWRVEKDQADCPSSGGRVGTRRVGYHRRDGAARAGRVVPAAPRGPYRRSRMPDTTRRPAPPRA